MGDSDGISPNLLSSVSSKMVSSISVLAYIFLMCTGFVSCNTSGVVGLPDPITIVGSCRIRGDRILYTLWGDLPSTLAGDILLVFSLFGELACEKNPTNCLSAVWCGLETLSLLECGLVSSVTRSCTTTIAVYSTSTVRIVH